MMYKKTDLRQAKNQPQLVKRCPDFSMLLFF